MVLFMRVSGRLTECDLNTCKYTTEHTLPRELGGSPISDDKLEFYEWLNHNGISRSAFRSLHTGLRRFVMECFEDYIEGRRPELFNCFDKEHSFREWLSLAGQDKRTLDDLSKESYAFQQHLLSVYLGI